MDKIFGAVVGGIKGFLFKIAFSKLWKEIIYPGVTWVFRKVKTFFNGIKYRKKARKLEEAKTEDEFDEATDDMP